MTRKEKFTREALHIVALFCLAVTQPLLDLLARNPEFLTAHKASKGDVLTLLSILFIALPLTLILIELLFGLFGTAARRYAHTALVALMFTVIVLPPLHRNFQLPGFTLCAISLALGFAATFAYIRLDAVRMFLTVLSPLPILSLGVFLFQPSVSRLIIDGEGASRLYARVAASAPVVFLVLDELPTASLLDEQGEIDPVRYPNLAALSQHSYWFRNHATVSPDTKYAVPAILSGSYPDLSGVPTIAHYPNNIFTLLGGSYEMRVFESTSMLCPKNLCAAETGSEEIQSQSFRLLSDVFIVYLHILLPADLTTSLPSVTQTWKDFGHDEGPARAEAEASKPWLRKDRNHKRVALFKEFLETITKSDKPRLYLAHSMLPHVPWNLLPSGKSYVKRRQFLPGLAKEQWSENVCLVNQAYQRHLMQVGFVDKLIGDLVSKLKAENLYESSLIVITADHGASFWPGATRRYVNDGHLADILRVPLLIKAPDQQEPHHSNRYTTAVDILPTVAAFLDVEVPWNLEGYSAIGTRPRASSNESLLLNGEVSTVRPLAGKLESLERKFSLFSSEEDPSRLFSLRPKNELIGQSIDGLVVGRKAEVEIEFHRASSFSDVDPESGFIPALVTGKVRTPRTDEDLELAIAINGTIEAIACTFDHDQSTVRFSALVPEGAFRSGRNDVEALVVSKNSDGTPRLQQLRSRKGG